MRILFAGLGILCVALAAIGVVLPLLPTVPFLLLAAFFFARSSDKLHAWILNHNTFGPMIVDWNESGAIRPGAKKAATASVAAVFSISVVADLATHILLIQAVTLSLVMLFIWTRPNG
ncbi:YbaN family protein [Epibacterium ulvae]|uniref:YbaN family protein n=1 Tax=Epibacterium ulvae TaxID=1156985 RepID=UPI001BFBFB24|nr:YbaN family protein [Epibacterium ulvae]MBT8153594.1 YbaN family protein [Epibacterium ulvae]